MEPDFIYTHENYRLIHELCGIAHQYKIFYCIAGYAGAGKTFALQEFYRKSNNTIYITLGKSTSARDLFNELLNGLRREGIERSESKGFLKRLIIDEIDRIEGRKLIIIDETGQLEGVKLAYLKEIRDITKHKCGMVLAAHKDFMAHSIKWIKKGVVGVEELISRIYETYELKYPSDQEIHEYFEFINLKHSQRKLQIKKEFLKRREEDRSWREIWQEIELVMIEEQLPNGSKKLMFS